MTSTENSRVIVLNKVDPQTKTYSSMDCLSYCVLQAKVSHTHTHNYITISVAKGVKNLKNKLVCIVYLKKCMILTVVMK